MFEFFLQYPPAVYSRGKFVLLTAWPAWLLALLAVSACGLLAWNLARHSRRTAGFGPGRAAAVWALQSVTAALLLVMLWQPALTVSALQPQQNLIAVLVDESRSMGIVEDGVSRLARIQADLGGGLMDKLRSRFQVRQYRFGASAARLDDPGALAAAAPATHLGAAIRDVMADCAGLPLGALVVFTDGADNSGGLERETIDELRSRRIPVHAVGVGSERLKRDIELVDAILPARALAESRLQATVITRQEGFSGRQARILIRESGRVLAAEKVTLGRQAGSEVHTVFFPAGKAGARNLEVSVEPLEGETNTANNALLRLVHVASNKPRLLYLEGEPRWEFKFIRRAIDPGGSLQLTTVLRTTQNNLYRQGITGPNELEHGLPDRQEDLFAFHGVIVGSVEAGYFSPVQVDLLRQFVDRRGGGILFLGGRSALAEGGYGVTGLADLLPVALPANKNTFRRDPARASLTPAGGQSLICRLEEDPARNQQRWSQLPAMADYQDAGAPKPAAVLLAELSPEGGNRKLPFLVTQNYGHGRTAVLATGGTWRWQMLQPHTDMSHETFWRQLLLWLVTDAPGLVSASTPQPVISDTPRTEFRAIARDSAYQPAADARLEARILGPNGLTATVALDPSAEDPGVYTAKWAAEQPGNYMAEVVAFRGQEELGRDVLMFRREDGLAEDFRTEQHRELLERLGAETGGSYRRAGNVARLADEISYSEGGITVRETKLLWNVPAVFLALLALRTAEWLLRRKWRRV